MDSRDDEATAIEKRARELFDASVEMLDGHAHARLAGARRDAVNQVLRRRTWRSWAPVAAMASAAMVAVLLWRMQGPESPATAGNVAADTTSAPMELLADGEDLGLVQNDLAFYEWLDATGFEAGGSSG